MKRLAILLALVLAVGAGWYFGSPWWTLRQMKAAADQGDISALSAHVDYPAVRASVKQQLGVGIGASRAVPELGGLGKLLETALADRLVDAAVSEDGLRVIFLTAPIAAQRAPMGLRAEDMTLRHEGLDQFRLVSTKPEGGSLIFQRSGIGWKLSGVELPEGRSAIR